MVLRYYYLHKFQSEADRLQPVPSELKEELEWAAARPLSQSKGKPISLDDDEPFQKALTFTEERFRLSYAEQKPRQVWQLNQNPDSGFGASSHEMFLPTVIANAHMLYTERVSPARWLLGSEALATQGFPIVPHLWNIPPASFPMLCTFNIPSPSRKSRHLLEQAGDSMNTMQMTVFTLHGLTQWTRRPLPPLMANIRLSRAAVKTLRKTVNFEEAPPPVKRHRAKGPG